jgi:hydroxymethylbilane synthase
MDFPKELRIGTRASALARWQANWVRDELVRLGFDVSIVPIATQGDRDRQSSLADFGGQGVFTKEIQKALLQGTIDLAVHSLKDLPTVTVAGLQLAAVPKRASSSDALVSHAANSLRDLPSTARVATGSPRRRAQLLHFRSNFQFVDLRGNVDTRLRKLDEGECDALILAEAGLKRLGLAHRITELISPDIMLPAIGQGALGIEIRSGDEPTFTAVTQLNDTHSELEVLAERSMLSALQAGCLAPVGVFSSATPQGITLTGVVLNSSGTRRLVASSKDTVDAPLELGKRVAEDLFSQGAAELIAESGA